MAKWIQEGTGWRVGWDDTLPPHPALVGNEHWAIELTLGEFQALRRLAQSLAETMAAMAEHVMAEEDLSCEMDSPHVWLEATGSPQSYSLHLLLLQGRRGEGHWPAAAVPGLLGAIAAIDPAQP